MLSPVISLRCRTLCVRSDVSNTSQHADDLAKWFLAGLVTGGVAVIVVTSVFILAGAFAV